MSLTQDTMCLAAGAAALYMLYEVSRAPAPVQTYAPSECSARIATVSRAPAATAAAPAVEGAAEAPAFSGDMAALWQTQLDQSEQLKVHDVKHGQPSAQAVRDVAAKPPETTNSRFVGTSVLTAGRAPDGNANAPRKPTLLFNALDA